MAVNALAHGVFPSGDKAPVIVSGTVEETEVEANA